MGRVQPLVQLRLRERALQHKPQLIAEEQPIRSGADLLQAPIELGFVACPAQPVVHQTIAESESDREKAPGGRRRVLIIASRFPPVASVGAIRVRKFVKYLPRHGWEPFVITGAMRSGQVHREDARRATDHEGLREIPSMVVVRRLSPVLDHWPTHVTRSLAHGLGRWTARIGAPPHRWNRMLSWRLRALHDALSFPDRGIWRLPSAVRLAMDEHVHRPFDAVFTSGMPFSDHLIGLALHELCRIPWLADFRDPWVEYVHWQQWKSSWGHRMTCWAEAAVAHRAAFVISVNDAMTQRFRARYRRLPGEKFVTLPNGFDPDDFPAQRMPLRSSEFRLLYAGSLYGARSPVNVLEAFRRFINQTPGSAARARFDFAGRPGTFLNELNHPEHSGRVRYRGNLPHAEAVQAMREADVNVVLLPNLPGGANDSTAKIYECLGSGRFVLAVVPADSAAAAVLTGFDGVRRCDPDNVDSIAQAIGDLYRRWLTDDLCVHRPAGALLPMTRSHQAVMLANLLNHVVKARRK